VRPLVPGYAANVEAESPPGRQHPSLRTKPTPHSPHKTLCSSSERVVDPWEYRICGNLRFPNSADGDSPSERSQSQGASRTSLRGVTFRGRTSAGWPKGCADLALGNRRCPLPYGSVDSVCRSCRAGGDPGRRGSWCLAPRQDRALADPP